MKINDVTATFLTMALLLTPLFIPNLYSAHANIKSQTNLIEPGVLPFIIPEFPEIPGEYLLNPIEVQGLINSQKNLSSNVILIGSPVGLVLPISSQTYNLIKEGNKNITVKLFDSNLEEFDLTAKALNLGEEIGITTTSPIPSITQEGEGTIVFLNNGDAIEKAKVTLALPKLLVFAGDSTTPPIIDDVSVIVTSKSMVGENVVKLIISGKNFQEKSITVKGKTFKGKGFTTSVVSAPKEISNLFSVKVLQGKEVLIAKLKINNEDLGKNFLIGVVTPFGISYKEIFIPECDGACGEN